MDGFYDPRNLSQDNTVRLRAAREYQAAIAQARKRFAWIWIRNRVGAGALFVTVMSVASYGGLLYGRWAETTLGRIVFYIISVVVALFVIWLISTHDPLKRVANRWGSEEEDIRNNIDSMKSNMRSLSRERDVSN